MAMKNAFGSNEVGSCGYIVETDGYFHAVTRNRRTVNRFTTLEDDQGIAHHEEHYFTRIISSYFSDIFAAQGARDLSTVHDVSFLVSYCL